MPRCDEWIFALRAFLNSAGMTARSPWKIIPSCTELSSRIEKYGSSSGGSCSLSPGQPLIIIHVDFNSYISSSDSVAFLISRILCSVIGRDCIIQIRSRLL